MPLSKPFLFFLLLLNINFGFSQNTADENKTKIATALENYFDLEREAIHLHLDKNTFINNETIWYKGYVINRKTNKPYFTTNVFVILYDENGNPVSEKLQYASNGIFFGKIDLGPKFKSGQYHIQAYTNWMNNFGENESTITKINIIDPNEGFKNYSKINTQSLEITLNPDGKSYVLGIPNQVGIQVKDCRGNAPENAEAKLLNSQNQVLKTIKLNKFGFGKFEVQPTQENLKVSLSYNGSEIEKQLPKAEDLGYTLDINNFTIESKTIIKVRTNAPTANAMKGKKIYLLIHQDQKYSLYDVVFDPSSVESTAVVNNKDLFDGINTVRIIDSDLKEWALRLIYFSEKKETSITVSKNNTKDNKISFAGYSPYPNSSISISVLPDETKSLDNNSIVAGLTVNPYLTSPLQNAGYYLNNPGRVQRYELDLALLNQQQLKYEWNSIKTVPPKANYTFDIGITLKGAIDTDIANKTAHKAKLKSVKDFIMMQSDVNEKGEYSFEHILLADSTYVNMSLQKLPNFNEIKTPIRPQIIGRKRVFNKPFRVDPPSCASDDVEYITDFDMPKFNSNVIQLDEVKLQAKKKKLEYENRVGNQNLRAYKIDETVHFRDILGFIEMNGFIVNRNRGNVSITVRQRNSLNAAQSTPDVYIDERKLMSFDELDIVRSDEIDEVYLDPYAIVPGMGNKQGVIKIYRKKNTANYKEKPDPNSFYIKDGFARYFGFKNSDYLSTQSAGFFNYGLIYWIPKTTSDENGQFLFDITDYNMERCKLVIEGMTSDGKAFHEEKTVNLK